MIIITYSLCISNKYYLISDNKIIYAWQGHAHLSAPMVIPGGNNFNHQTLHSPLLPSLPPSSIASLASSLRLVQGPAAILLPYRAAIDFFGVHDMSALV